MARSVKEWIGKTDDTPVPPRVRLRVLERYERRCYLSDRPIRSGDKWQPDHILALINGGENRESNLAPVLVDKHKEKTAADVAEKSKSAEIRKKHFGIKTKKSRGFRGWRRFNGDLVYADKGKS